MKNGRTLKFTLAALFMLTLMLCMSIGASADGELYYGEAEIKLYGTATTSDVVAAASVDERALDYVIKKHREGVDEILLYDAGYRVGVSKLYSLQQARMYAAPDLFYVSNAYSYSYTGGGYVYAIYPEYLMTGSTLNSAKAEYKSMISHITEQAEGLETDLEKALFYHEYIVANYEYDTDYSIYDAYNMLTEKKGVCQAYTLLYSELLNRAGIDNTAVLSDGLCHVWNALEINGSWFLADLTWDDPVNDIPGRVYHSFFLRSSGSFGHLLSNGVCDWVVSDGRTLSYSSYYDSAFWVSLEGWVHPYDGALYYKNTDNGSTYVYSRPAASISTVSRLFSINSRLYADGGYYPGYLGFCGLGDKLYYAASGEHGRAYVYEYDIDDKTRSWVYTYSHTCSGSGCYRSILSLFPDGDRILFNDADFHSSESGTVGYFELIREMPMDVNADGSVTNADITVFVRYLSGWQGLTFSAENADVDKNGKYNNRDLIAIIRYVNG